MQSIVISSVLVSLALPTLALGQAATSAAGTAPEASALDRAFDIVFPLPADSRAHPERFSEFVINTVGPVPVLGEAAGAAIGQGLNSPEEWGQGWAPSANVSAAISRITACARRSPMAGRTCSTRTLDTSRPRNRAFGRERDMRS